MFYELPVGTSTPEGSFAAATERLAHLRELGSTVVELMPIATFAGGYGWRRRLVLDNARYWLEEVHFDGLCLDAAHVLEPGGEPHILAALSTLAKACSPSAVLIAVDDCNAPVTCPGSA